MGGSAEHPAAAKEASEPLGPLIPDDCAVRRGDGLWALGVGSMDSAVPVLIIAAGPLVLLVVLGLNSKRINTEYGASVSDAAATDRREE